MNMINWLRGAVTFHHTWNFRQIQAKVETQRFQERNIPHMKLQEENWKKLFSGPTEAKVRMHSISDCGEETKEEVSRQRKTS
jgi:hypothetical protein